jgi:ABC-type transport system involved in multi-copper enzyme maturation permease subunit
MRYVAILKDSFREALDYKIIYVMIGLTALAVAFVGTISFTPAPARETMQSVINGHHLTMFTGEPRFYLDYHLRLVDVKVLEGEPDSPDSTYEVRFQYGSHKGGVMMHDGGGPDQDFAAEGKKRHDAEVKLALKDLPGHFQPYEDFELFTIRDIRPVEPTPEQVKFGNTPDPEFTVTVAPAAGTRRYWSSEMALFFGALPMGSMPLGPFLFQLSSRILTMGAWFAVLVSIIVTASFVPNMLRKGTLDLLLVRPTQRWLLLLYKYGGGLTFMLINTTVAVMGLWFVLGLRSGIWANSLLLLIFVLTFFFAILYALSLLFGVLTRSPITSILVTCVFALGLLIVGNISQGLDQMEAMEEKTNRPEEHRVSNSTGAQVFQTIHFFLPRPVELNQLAQQFIVRDFVTGKWTGSGQLAGEDSISWGESLGVSVGFIAVMLGLSCWRFERKDY